jgi:hypothetical protein
MDLRMRLNSLNAIILFAVICGIAGCKKEDSSPESSALGYSYFPLEEGKVTYYQVDSIGWMGYTYDPITHTVDIDTLHYQIKEVVNGFFLDNEGRETAEIRRYRRNDASQPWIIYKVYSANLTPTRAERYEDNVRYVKLIFPPEENEKWIGQYVDVPSNDTIFEPWEYEYETVNEPGFAGALSFDSVSTVILKSDVNLIEYRYYIEQYAAGTGLIYKEYNDLDYLSTTSSFIKNGFIYKETIINP